MFPGWSPYAFALDNPIRFIDREGKGPLDAIRRVITVADGMANEIFCRSFLGNGGTDELGFFVSQITTGGTNGATVIKITDEQKITNGSTGMFSEYEEYNRRKEQRTSLGQVHTHAFGNHDDGIGGAPSCYDI